MRVKKTEEEKANKQLKLVIKTYLINRDLSLKSVEEIVRDFYAEEASHV